MITRTAKGTVVDKTDAPEIRVSAVSITKGDYVVIGFTQDAPTSAPTRVRWGKKDIDQLASVSGGGIITRLHGIRIHRATDTRPVVIQWKGNIPTAKVMFVTVYTEIGRLDQSSGGTDAASTIASSGALQTSLYANEVFVGAMGSEGPSGDATGTPSNSYTAGQRAGTTGGAADSNVTIQEIFKIVSATEATRARLSGATARDWASVLTTLRDRDRPFVSTTTFTGEIQHYVDAIDATEAEAKTEALSLADIQALNGTVQGFQVTGLTSLVVIGVPAEQSGVEEAE